MNLLNKLRKPAWQSANPEKRAAAVGSGDDPELLAALPRLAIDDPEAPVRQQALRRCDDPALYARAARQDGDTTLRAWARQRWLQALEQGRAALDDATLDSFGREEIERLAVQLSSADDRRRLLARIERPGFLAERALSDPDPELRIEVLQRIDQVPTLERIAEQARKHDKRLARAARERADTLSRSSGNDEALRQHAERLCHGVEQLFRDAHDPADRSQRLQQLKLQWQAMDEGQLPQGLQARFHGACAVVQAQLAPPIAPDIVAATPEPTIDGEVEVEIESGPPAPPSPEEIAAKVRLQAELAIQAGEVERERKLTEQAQREREQARQENEQRLEGLKAALESGDLGRARTLASELDPERLGSGAKGQWQRLQPRMKELQGWEHWANNKVRARLCEEIEAMIGSGLHPDALATKVREVQQRWRELDVLEGRAEGAEASGLDKRFRVVCARVMKPARGFFEKRDALRDAQQQEIKAFLDQCADSETITELDALMTLQQRAIEHLRALGSLAPPVRKRLASRLRALLDALKPRLEAGFGEIESARQGLIEQARALTNESDGRRVGNQARELNQRWKSLGKGRPGRDQAQWRQFRAALDAAFGSLDERRQERDAELSQRQEQARAVIAELEQLALLPVDALTAGQAQSRELIQQWRDLAVRDPALGDAWDSALTRYRQAQADLERGQQRQRYLDWIQINVDCPDSSDVTAVTAAQHLVFEAEGIAELQGPDDESAARRSWQMERLQQHMRGERAEGRQGLEQVLERWSQLAGLDSSDRERFSLRLRTAIDAVLSRS